MSLPGNLEAERSVLGSILVTEGRALDAVADTLTADDFSTAAHRTLFATLVQLVNAGHPVDVVALKDALLRARQLEAVGGPAYVASLADGVPRSTNVAYYARIVRFDAVRRKVILLAEGLAAQARQAELEPSELIDAAEKGLLDVSTRAVPGEPVTAHQLGAELFETLEVLHRNKGRLTGLDTGFKQLNYFTHGLQPGSMNILAGRPGTGKSALALQISLHAAQSVPVLFFSVEMSRREQGVRAMALLGSMDGHAILGGYLSDKQQQQAALAIAALQATSFIVDDSGSLTPMQIRSRARRQKARSGLGLLVVDYLQLLKHDKADSREQSVAATSRALKLLARELDVPCLVLCQLSRQAEASKDQRPMLSHLRESGSLEQDADTVMLIHKPPPQPGAMASAANVQLIIAKNRHGPQDEIDLTWAGEQYRFTEAARWSA